MPNEIPNIEMPEPEIPPELEAESGTTEPQDQDELESGQDAAEEPSGGADENQPEPQYITREQFDQSVAGLTQEMRRQLEQMQMLLQHSQPQAQPDQQQKQPGDEFPDFMRFQQEVLADPQKFYGLMRQIYDANHRNTEEVRKQIDYLRQQAQVEKQTEQYYQYITQQTDAAIAAHPALQGDKAKETLKRLVAAEITIHNGDIRKLDIPKIAKGLADFIGEASKSDKKPAQPAPAGNRPAPGSPTKPAQKQGGVAEVSSLDEFEAGIDKLVEQYEGE